MIGNKKIVHFLSAADRINYGDLLFPIIFKRFAKKNNYNITFYNYGIVESDLTFFGALPTMSYKRLIKGVNKKGGKLVVGGGEVFFANWSTLFSFISPVYLKLLKYPFFKKIEKELSFAKYMLSGNKILIPFCPSVNEFKNKSIKIYFNSVGGNFTGNKNSFYNEKIVKSLKNTSFLSVRDQRSLNSMKSMELEAALVPDSAILMSDFFNKDELIQKITIRQIPEEREYIFLQLGKYKGPDNLHKFAKDIKRISDVLNLDVILCPIGKAPRHEDDIILKELNLIEEKFSYIEPNNIYDIMYLISNSSLYIGTSLHGIITAQSFNIPVIGLNNKLIKVKSYIQTWIQEDMSSLSFNEIEKIESIYKNWNFNKFITKLELQKKLVEENLMKILDDDIS